MIATFNRSFARSIKDTVSTLINFLTAEGSLLVQFMQNSGFTFSGELTKQIEVVKNIRQSIEVALGSDEGRNGATNNRLKDMLSGIENVNAQIEDEVLEYIDAAPTAFKARYDALVGTKAHESFAMRFSHELRLFEHAIEPEGIFLNVAIKAYMVMNGVVSYIEQQADGELEVPELTLVVDRSIKSPIRRGRDASKREADRQRREQMKEGGKNTRRQAVG